MKNCTDIEQSKKLIELGIDINTADMMWDDWSLIDEGWKLSVGYYPEIEKDYGRKCYPAWSLAALLDILKNRAYSIDEDANVSLSSYKNVEWWDLSISNLGLEAVTKSDLVDACVEMIFTLMIFTLKERKL